MATRTEEKSETRLGAGDAEAMIGYKLRLAQILSFRSFEQQLSEHGRAPRYLGLLSVIRTNPGQPQSRLAEAVGLRRSSLVTILDQLSDEGLIARRASDRRTNGIWLTERGEEVVDSLMEEGRQHDAIMTQHLSDEDVGNAIRVLDQIIANLLDDFPGGK